MSLNKPRAKRVAVRHTHFTPLAHQILWNQADDPQVIQRYGTNQALKHENFRTMLCTYCVISDSEQVCWRFPPVGNNQVISDSRCDELDGLVGT